MKYCSDQTALTAGDTHTHAGHTHTLKCEVMLVLFSLSLVNENAILVLCNGISGTLGRAASDVLDSLM